MLEKTKLSYFVYYLFFSFVLLSCKSAGERALEKARKLIEIGQTAQALELIDRHIEELATNANAYFLRGNAYFIQKNYNATISAYETFIKLGSRPNEPVKFYSNYGVSLYHAEKIPDAIEQLETVSSSKEFTPQSSCILAQLYISNGQSKKARKALARCKNDKDSSKWATDVSRLLDDLQIIGDKPMGYFSEEHLPQLRLDDKIEFMDFYSNKFLDGIMPFHTLKTLSKEDTAAPFKLPWVVNSVGTQNGEHLATKNNDIYLVKFGALQFGAKRVLLVTTDSMDVKNTITAYFKKLSGKLIPMYKYTYNPTWIVLTNLFPNIDFNANLSIIGGHKFPTSPNRHWNFVGRLVGMTTIDDKIYPLLFATRMYVTGLSPEAKKETKGKGLKFMTCSVGKDFSWEQIVKLSETCSE